MDKKCDVKYETYYLSEDNIVSSLGYWKFGGSGTVNEMMARASKNYKPSTTEEVISEVNSLLSHLAISKDKIEMLLATK